VILGKGLNKEDILEFICRRSLDLIHFNIFFCCNTKTIHLVCNFEKDTYREENILQSHQHYISVTSRKVELNHLTSQYIYDKQVYTFSRNFFISAIFFTHIFSRHVSVPRAIIRRITNILFLCYVRLFYSTDPLFLVFYNELFILLLLLLIKFIHHYKIIKLINIK
jgi:hypothetical protein